MNRQIMQQIVPAVINEDIVSFRESFERLLIKKIEEKCNNIRKEAICSMGFKKREQKKNKEMEEACSKKTEEMEEACSKKSNEMKEACSKKTEEMEEACSKKTEEMEEDCSKRRRGMRNFGRIKRS